MRRPVCIVTPGTIAAFRMSSAPASSIGGGAGAGSAARGPSANSRTSVSSPVAGDFERLVHAVAAAAGIEALVTLTDLGGLSRERAVDVMRWSTQALLRAALPGGN